MILSVKILILSIDFWDVRKYKKKNFFVIEIMSFIAVEKKPFLNISLYQKSNKIFLISEFSTLLCAYIYNVSYNQL